MLEIENQYDTVQVNTFKGLFYYNLETNENITDKEEWNKIIDSDCKKYLLIHNKAKSTLEQILQAERYRISEIKEFGYNTSDYYKYGLIAIFDYEVEFK